MTGETPALSLGIMFTGGKKPNITPFVGSLRTTCHKVKSIHSKNSQHILLLPQHFNIFKRDQQDATLHNSI